MGSNQKLYNIVSIFSIITIINYGLVFKLGDRELFATVFEVCRNQLSRLFLESDNILEIIQWTFSLKLFNEYKIFPLLPVDYSFRYFEHIVINHGYDDSLLLPPSYCRNVLYKMDLSDSDEKHKRSDDFDNTLPLLDTVESSSSHTKKRRR